MHILMDTSHTDYPKPLCIARLRKENPHMSCFAAGINKVTGEYDFASQIYNSEVGRCKSANYTPILVRRLPPDLLEILLAPPSWMAPLAPRGPLR